MDLTNPHRTFHPAAAEHTFFSSTYRTFSRTDNLLGHKASLNKFKKIEFLSSIFFDHNGMKLESIIGRKSENSQIHGRAGSLKR